MEFNSKTLKPGDIITVNESVDCCQFVKEPENTGRKFRVLKLYKTYVLCEHVVTKYKECFLYPVLNQKVVKIKRAA